VEWLNCCQTFVEEISLSLCPIIALIHIAASGCDDNGIRVWFNGDKGRFDTAYADSGNWPGDSYIEVHWVVHLPRDNGLHI
jgi:hypothetical protein